MSETDPLSLRIDLMGAPLGDGAGHKGTLLGPAALRIGGLAETLRDLGHEVRDLGDVTPATALPYPPDDGRAGRSASLIASWTKGLDEKVYGSLAGGRYPVVMGGDHSLSMGSVAGAARYWREQGRAFFVLWLDAHPDYNTPATSPSGNMHGMSAAMLCGEPGFDAAFARDERVLDPSHLTVFGVRSIDRLERQLLAERGIDVVDMRSLDEFGAGVMMTRFIDRVRDASGVVHVSFDVDSLDPGVAPGVGTAVPGGMTYREAHLVMEMLHDSGLVHSLDAVELNPFLDEKGRTALVMIEMISSLFGRKIIERRAWMAGGANPNFPIHGRREPE